MMHVVHLLASPFLGGPERQVLGLASASRSQCRTSFLSFAESGKARPLIDKARECGFEAQLLESNFPRLNRAVVEVADRLRQLGADVLCCSGYKPDLVGWRAARRAGIPVVGIAHGWTGVTLKVRLYERLDAVVMRWLDRTVCVSEAMAQRCRRAGVPANKLVVIRNAVDATPYERDDPDCRHRLESFFADRVPARIIGAVGRLSPEKGFDVLVAAFDRVSQKRADTGLVIFGDGPLRQALEQQISACGLIGRVVLGGFRGDLDRLLPGLDLAVSSSHTEGLPVAVLEAQAAGLAVVGTAVGGTPEVVIDGTTGYLCPPGDPEALAERLLLALAEDERRLGMGRKGRQRVREEFTFAAGAGRYLALFDRLVQDRGRGGR